MRGENLLHNGIPVGKNDNNMALYFECRINTTALFGDFANWYIRLCLYVNKPIDRNRVSKLLFKAGEKKNSFEKPLAIRG